jgi:hypothetical protein
MKVDRYNPRETLVLACFLLALVSAGVFYGIHRGSASVEEAWRRTRRTTEIGTFALQVLGDVRPNFENSHDAAGLLGPVTPLLSPYLAQAAKAKHFEEGDVPPAFLFASDQHVRLAVPFWGKTDPLEAHDYRITPQQLKLLLYDPTNGSRSEGIWCSPPIAGYIFGD